MKKTLYTISLIILIFSLNLNANEAVHQLAGDNQRGINLFKNLEDTFYQDVDKISKQKNLTSIQKQNRIKILRNGFMDTSRMIHARYRQPFLEAIIEETNSSLPNGRGIQRTLGSDIYERTDSGEIKRNTDGTPELNKKHRGMSGDLDLGGDPESIQRLKDTFTKYGVNPTTRGTYNHLDWDSVEVTINNGGVHINTVNNSTRVDSSLHDAQITKASINPDGTISAKKNIKLNADSLETYNSVAMQEKQAGKSLVLTLDNNKKTISGFRTSASDLLKPKSEAKFQGMNKGTLKSISSGVVTDSQIKRIIEKNYLGMSVNAFKDNLTSIKEGHIAAGIGITDSRTMSKYKNVCKDITNTAVDNATKVAKIEMDTVNNRIKELNNLVDSTPEGPTKESYKRQAKMWKEQNADSKLRIDSGLEANDSKLNAPTSKSKLATGVTGGLKAVGVLGDLADGYEVVDTLIKYNSGEITADEAIITVGTKSSEIAMDLASGAATSAATTTVATTTLGSVATVAAPLVVTMVATHYVSEATKEGLKMMAAFKNEKLLNDIADEQIKRVSQSFIKKANSHLTKLIRSGDFNDLVAAEDMSWKLYDMYERTGDVSLLDASQKISDRAESVQSFLEAEHGVSIYSLQSKMQKDANKVVDEQKVEKDTQTQNPNKNKRVVFFTDNENSLDKELAFKNSMDKQRERKANSDTERANSSLGNAMSQAQRESDAFVQSFRDADKALNDMGDEYLKEVARTEAINSQRNQDKKKAHEAIEAFRKKNYQAQNSNTQASNSFGGKYTDPHSQRLQNANTSRPKRSYEPVGKSNSSQTVNKYWAKITWSAEDKAPKKDFDNPTKYAPLKIDCEITSFKPNSGAKDFKVIRYPYRPLKKDYIAVKGYKKLVFGVYSKRKDIINKICSKDLNWSLQNKINGSMFSGRDGFTGEANSVSFIQSASSF